MLLLLSRLCSLIYPYQALFLFVSPTHHRRRQHPRSMYRIATRRAPTNTLWESCRTAITGNIPRIVITPSRRLPRATCPTSQTRRGDQTVSQATSAFGDYHDTIYALSSANGKAGIAVIRISGPCCTLVSNDRPSSTTIQLNPPPRSIISCVPTRKRQGPAMRQYELSLPQAQKDPRFLIPLL